MIHALQSSKSWNSELLMSLSLTYNCPTVIGGGGTALRDFVSDAVGNATQDANYKGLYLPFYTVGTGVGEDYIPALISRCCPDVRDVSQPAAYRQSICLAMNPSPQ